MLTKAEVAARLRLSPRTVTTLAHEGHLRAMKIGRSVRFREQDVEDYLKRASKLMVRAPKKKTKAKKKRARGG
jgi:excisionase family DNA binding protein